MDPALRELLRVHQDRPDQVVEAIIRLRRPDIELPGVRIVARFGTVATCRLPVRLVTAVHDHDDVLTLKAPRTVSTPDDVHHGENIGVAGPSARPRTWPTGAPAIVGFIDWRLDVAHPDFRHADGSTRVLALWDQRDGQRGTSPEPYGYGVVHDRVAIDAALATGDPYGELSYAPGDASHGTHVAGIAVGNGLAGGPIGVAPDAGIVFVDLGAVRKLRTSARMLEGVDFVRQTAGSAPWVVNISAGQTGGPHDDSSPVVRAFDELLASIQGGFISQSGGNYAEARLHASGTLTTGDVRTLTFIKQATDTTPDELEIWYDGADELLVELCPPGGEPILVALDSDEAIVFDGREIGWIYHRARDPNGDNHVDAFLAAEAPAGRWTVTLRAIRAASGRFHAWIERDDGCSGCQARFVPADADPTTTVGSIATGHLPLIVGAYDSHRPGRPIAPFSSRGPTRDGYTKPDVLGAGVGIVSARSSPSGDMDNRGMYTVKSGSSMSSPQVAGAVALCWEAMGARLSAAEIRDLVLSTASPVPGPADPNRSGCGYLDLNALVAALAERSGPSQEDMVMPLDTAALDVGPGHPERVLNAPAAFDLDRLAPLAIAPSVIYRELLYRPDGPAANWIRQHYEVLAGPGQEPSRSPQAGDVALSVVLGHPGPGTCAALTGADLVQRTTYRSRPSGWYAPAVSVLDDFRGTHCRILDAHGRAPGGVLLLGPRVVDPTSEEVADDTDSPAWRGTPDQIEFCDRVLAEHLARTRTRRGPPQRDLRDDELAEITGTGVRTARATAAAADRLLDAARADLVAAQAASDQDALRTTGLTVTSGYRGSDTQRQLWLRYFSAKGGYYDRTLAARAALPDGPHSEQAVDYLLRPRSEGGFGLGGRIAAPGYSNHQNGSAVDLYQQRTAGHTVRNDSDDVSRARWRASWFHHWLLAHARNFGFHPLSSEEWHWEFRGPPRPPAEAELADAATEADPDTDVADADTDESPNEAPGETLNEAAEVTSSDGEDIDGGLLSALGKRDWSLALSLAIRAGWRDENELTNLIFFARHPELPPEPLKQGDPNFTPLSAEWMRVLDKDVWKAIETSAENTDLVVSGKEVTEHHREFFRGPTGRRLKKLVEDAAGEAGLNPGLLGTIMMAETRRPLSYLSIEKVSSYHIGCDDFYEGRTAIQARVPAYAKVKWDRSQTPVEHLNDAEKNPRMIKTILFDSGPDGALATAVYLKFREVRLREIAAKLHVDFDSLPLPTRFALTRMAMAAGTGGATPYLKDALNGVDIFVRTAIPVRAYQTQRNATVRTAQAMHLSDWVFGLPVGRAARSAGHQMEEAQTEEALGHPQSPMQHSAPGSAGGIATVTVPDWTNIISPFPTQPKLDFTLDDAKMKTAFATVTANNPTNLCVALVDVTDSPVRPPYAGSNDQDMLYPGSMTKIGALYAAFALKKQVQKFLDAASANSASTAAADIFPIISAAWRPKLKSLFPSRPEKPFNLSQDVVVPQLDAIFDVVAGKVLFKSSPSTTDKEIDFDGDSAPGRFAEWLRSMARWSSDTASSKVVDALGYFYINGALGDAGFFVPSSPTDGKGLWLSADYEAHDWVTTAHEKKVNAAGPRLTRRWADVQVDVGGPRVRGNITATAFHTAKLMALMATDNLVDADSSQKMRTLLASAILHIATSNKNEDGIGSYFKDALCGNSRAFDALQAKKGYGNDRFSHECGIIERTVGGKKLKYVAVVLGSAPSQQRVDFSAMVVRLDDAIIARNH